MFGAKINSMDSIGTDPSSILVKAVERYERSGKIFNQQQMTRFISNAVKAYQIPDDAEHRDNFDPIGNMIY